MLTQCVKQTDGEDVLPALWYEVTAPKRLVYCRSRTSDSSKKAEMCTSPLSQMCSEVNRLVLPIPESPSGTALSLCPVILRPPGSLFFTSMCTGNFRTMAL